MMNEHWGVYEDDDVCESFGSRVAAEAFVMGCEYYSTVTVVERVEDSTTYRAMLNELAEEEESGRCGQQVTVRVVRE